MGKNNFVISARNVVDEGKKKARFGTEPGDSHYLVVPDGQLPQPIDRQQPGRDQWVKQVVAAAKQGTYKDPDHPLTGYSYGDVVVFVHGFNNNMETVMKRHDLLQKRLAQQGYNGAVVSFDWPSASLPLNYLEDRSDAQKTALQLVTDGIALLARQQLLQDEQKCDINVHLLGHSTGAYVIREAFYQAGHHKRLARVNWQVSQVVFIGGDVAKKSLSRNDDKSQGLFTHATRITNYQNPVDSALKLSNIKRLGMAPRAGRVGLPGDAPDHLVNVHVEACYNHWKDDEQIEGSGSSHAWHFDNPMFAEDLVHTLKGDIDRASIPTRRRRQDGGLELRES